MFRGRFRTHGFDWKLLKEYLHFVQKSTFFQRVARGGKGIFHLFMSLGIPRRVVNLSWESFLSANNALTENFVFNSHPFFILSGLFLCP